MACQEWVAEREEGGWNLNIKGCPDWSPSRNVGDTWTAGLYIILCRALRPNLRTVLQLLSPTKRKLPHYNNAISKSLSSSHCAGQYGEWLLILACGWLWHVDNHNWASLCVSSCGRKTRNSYLIKWISLVPQSRSEGGAFLLDFGSGRPWWYTTRKFSLAWDCLGHCVYGYHQLLNHGRVYGMTITLSNSPKGSPVFSDLSGYSLRDWGGWSLFT